MTLNQQGIVMMPHEGDVLTGIQSTPVDSIALEVSHKSVILRLELS
jgi:hypothetical protein